MNFQLPTQSESLQKRRSSTRSIKRKKFADEVVESSLIKTERAVKAKVDGKSGEAYVMPVSVPTSVEKIEVPVTPQAMERKKVYIDCVDNDKYTW